MGAQKLLRGLYERAVTLEYIRQNPEKAERFIRFAAVQEFKAANRALEAVSRDQFDGEMARIGTSYGAMRDLHDRFKDEFQQTRCKKCGTKATAISWDTDVVSMANRLGEPYRHLLLGSYTLPTLQAHATLASAFSSQADAARDTRIAHAGRFSLASAMLVFLAVLRSQDAAFALRLGDELEASGLQIGVAWESLSGTGPV